MADGSSRGDQPEHGRDIAPVTEQALAAGLRRLGVGEGMVMIVHSALSALGWVCGGPVAVIRALTRAVGADGTLVMPAHSGERPLVDFASHWFRRHRNAAD